MMFLQVSHIYLSTFVEWADKVSKKAGDIILAASNTINNICLMSLVHTVLFCFIFHSWV
jgi:hypothetical protein